MPGLASMGEDGLPGLAPRSSPSRHPGAGQHRLPRPGRHLHGGPGPRPRASLLNSVTSAWAAPTQTPFSLFVPSLPSGTLTAAGGVSFKPPLLGTGGRGHHPHATPGVASLNSVPRAPAHNPPISDLQKPLSETLNSASLPLSVTPDN